MASSHPPALLDRISFLLGKLYMRGLDLESSGLAELELNVKSHAVLTVLTDEGPFTQQELGTRLGIDRTTIVDVVDGLVRSGFVERERNPADRRANILIMTERGQGARARGAERVREAEATLLAKLGEEERATLRRLLAQAIE